MNSSPEGYYYSPGSASTHHRSHGRMNQNQFSTPYSSGVVRNKDVDDEEEEEEEQQAIAEPQHEPSEQRPRSTTIASSSCSSRPRGPATGVETKPKAAWRTKKFAIPTSPPPTASPPRWTTEERTVAARYVQSDRKNSLDNESDDDVGIVDPNRVDFAREATWENRHRSSSAAFGQNRPKKTFAAADRWNRVTASPPPPLPSLSVPRTTTSAVCPPNEELIPQTSTSTTSTATTPSPSITSSKDEDVYHDMDYYPRRGLQQLVTETSKPPMLAATIPALNPPQSIQTEEQVVVDPAPTRLRVSDVRSMFQPTTTKTIQETISRQPVHLLPVQPAKMHPSSPPHRTTNRTIVSPVPPMQPEDNLMTNHFVARTSPPLLRRTSITSVSPVPRISSPQVVLGYTNTQNDMAADSTTTKPTRSLVQRPSIDSTTHIRNNTATVKNTNKVQSQSPPRPQRRTHSLERQELMHPYPHQSLKPQLDAGLHRNEPESHSSSKYTVKAHTAPKVEATAHRHTITEDEEKEADRSKISNVVKDPPLASEINHFSNQHVTKEGAPAEPPILSKQQPQQLLPEQHQANSMIETPPKLSVSAMKAKLWGSDAQKFKVPIQRTRLDCAPTSPIADLRRIFDTGSHVTSPLSTPPPPPKIPRMQNNTRLSLSPQRPSQHKTIHDDDDDDDIDLPTRIAPIRQDDDTVDEGYNRTESELNMIADRDTKASILPPSDFYNHGSGHTTPSPVPPIVQPRLKHPITQKPHFMSQPPQNNSRINSPTTASSKQRLDQTDSSDFERKVVAVTEDLNTFTQRMDRGEWADHSSEIWAPLSDSFSEYDWINAAISRNKSGSSNEENNIAQKMKPVDKDRIHHHERQMTSPLSQRPSSSMDDAISSIGPIDADDLYFSMNADAQQDNEKDKVFRRTPGWNSAIGIHKSRASTPETPLSFINDSVFDPLDDSFKFHVDNTETTAEPTENKDLVELPNLFFDKGKLASQKLVRPIPARSLTKGVTEVGNIESVEDRFQHGLWSFDFGGANHPNLAHSDSARSHTRNINYPISIHSGEDIPDGICKTRAQSATASKVKAVEAVVSTHPITRCMRRLKWYLNGLFHRRINGVGVCRFVLAKKHFTYGQLVLLSPLLLFTAACTYTTFPNRSTSHSGNWAFYAVFYTFILAHKQASVFKMLGVSWDQLVPVHYAASVTAVILSIMHGYVAYTGHDYRPCREPGNFSMPELNDELPLCRDTRHNRKLGELLLADNPRFRHSMIGTDPDLWKFLWDGGRNVSGTWMLICLVTLLVLSAFRWTLRRPCFDVWLALHIAAAGAILAYSPKHRIQLYIVLVIWWALDGLLRYGLGTLFRLPKTATLTLLTWKKQGRSIDNSGESNDNSIVELSFNEKFHYKAGQYVRIAIVETGQPVMFHPMTISSAPYEDRVTIHFRPFGGWTRQIASMGARKGSARISGNIHVLLEGPYGLLPMNLWENPSRYPVVVLIAGGIGVTPIISLARQLLYEHKHAGRERKLIRVVWAVKEVGLVEALPLLGQEMQEESEISSKFMVDPWRMLQRNKRRDGVIRDHPVPLFNDPVVTDFVSPSRKPTPLFDASIYVTNQKSDMDILETNRSKRDVVPFCSRDRRCGSRPGEADVNGMERGDMEAPLPKKTSPPSQGKSDAACNYDDDRFSFYSGRPDIKFILNQTASSHVFAKDQRVAVIACGPQALVQDTKVACAQLREYVRMDFHEELFLL